MKRLRRDEPKPSAGEKKAPEGQPEAPKPADGKRSGRVTFDERGNAVWEWAMSTGEFGRNVDTRRLKKLEAKDLKIDETAQHTAPRKPSGAPSGTTKPGSGFDPYNSSGSQITPRNAPKAASKPTDLKRLSEWIKLQKSLGKKPDEK